MNKSTKKLEQFGTLLLINPQKNEETLFPTPLRFLQIVV